MIAALYVETGGCYFGLPDVDPWDEARDARLYSGPHPVICHPPCQLWTNMAHVNFRRYGKEKNRPGNDGGCFKAALEAVLSYCGVLEHPAGSHAWAKFGLPRPPRGRWGHMPGYRWFTEVSQSAYGHRARKRTWLFVKSRARPADLDWRDAPGTHQCGWFNRIKPTLGKREASRTPPAFRDLLRSIARSAAPGPEDK